MSTGKVRLTRDETMAETRRRLLDAAWRVFARQGFEGTSVKQIAEEAGYTTGAIYAHFTTKEELFLVLLRERFAAKVDDLGSIFDTPGDLNSQLEALSQRFGHLRETEGDWDLLATEFWLYAARHPATAEPLVERQRELRDGLGRIIARRLAEFGVEPATPPDVIASAVIALGDGLGALRRLDPRFFPDDLFSTAVLHLVTALATNAVGGQQPGG